MRALVVTVSDRAAAGVYEDRSGPAVADALRTDGVDVTGPRVVADGDPLSDVLREAVDEGYDVVITTGGTGLGPRDRTPEVTRALLDAEVPGIAEAVRSQGIAAGVPTAMLSRGTAGVAGTTLVVNLPGSAGGARDGIAVVLPVLAHAVAQLHGGGH